jgi:hypothetical protein
MMKALTPQAQQHAAILLKRHDDETNRDPPQHDHELQRTLPYSAEPFP